MVLVASLATAAYLLQVVERAYLARNDHRALVADEREAGPGTVVVGPVTEVPPDMFVPTLVLGAGSLLLGLANVAILTEILEPGVLARAES